jgi:hypothetical protein
MVNVLQAEALGTGLLIPSGDDPLDWAFSKAKGVADPHFAGMGAP